MNAEKFVKNEAKKHLTLNWPLAIFSIFVLLFLPIFILLLLEIAYSVIGETDKITEVFSKEPTKASFFVLFHILAVVGALLLSPLFNGFIKIFSDIANGSKTDPADLFCFFETKTQYKKAVKFMTEIIMKSVGIFILCEFIALGIISFGYDSDLFKSIGIAAAVIGLIISFLIIHRFAFSVVLFSYKGYDAADAVKTGAIIAKKNTGKLIRLTCSFIPWLLLCFFVVPIFYVYPYMTCSYMVSIKYLIRQYEESDEALKTQNAPEPFLNDSPITTETSAEENKAEVKSAVTLEKGGATDNL